MKKEKLKLLVLLAATLLFNSLFWQEKVALNAALYAVFIIPAVLIIYPEAWRRPLARWLILSVSISLAAVLLTNTLLSKITYFLCLFAFAGFAEYHHRSVIFAFGSVLENYLFCIPSLATIAKDVAHLKLNTGRWFRRIKFLLIPFVLLFIFGMIYLGANTLLQQYVGQLSQQLQKLLTLLFPRISLDRILFIFLGLLIACGLLLNNRKAYFSKWESFFHDKLKRQRKKPNIFFIAINDIAAAFLGRFANGMLALKNEYIIGCISIWLLNLLLLIVNAMDVYWLWLGNANMQNAHFSEMLHRGAGLLIFSLFLAIGILLFFFRGNLNFFKENKWLRNGAYLWLMQNALLAFSVWLRDYYYITNMGLTYKRIGIILFIVLTIAGLITMILKIVGRRSNYYLFRLFGWAIILVLLSASLVNWDNKIAKYNIAHKERIGLDRDFLLSLSDNALPVLYQNKQLFSDSTSQARLNKKLQSFQKRQAQLSWLSWNVPDQKVKDYFRQQHLFTSINQ